MTKNVLCPKKADLCNFGCRCKLSSLEKKRRQKRRPIIFFTFADPDATFVVRSIIFFLSNIFSSIFFFPFFPISYYNLRSQINMCVLFLFDLTPTFFYKWNILTLFLDDEENYNLSKNTTTTMTSKSYDVFLQWIF